LSKDVAADGRCAQIADITGLRGERRLANADYGRLCQQPARELTNRCSSRHSARRSDQALNARMNALGSAKPRSAAISPMRRSFSKRLCAASNRTSSARPEKVTPNAYLDHPEAKVSALCDADPAILARLAAEHTGAHATCDF
jgi:hypothetical protein